MLIFFIGAVFVEVVVIYSFVIVILLVLKVK